MTIVAVALVVGSLWLLPAGAVGGPGQGPALQPVGDLSWQEVLEAAMEASMVAAYDASLVVVTLDATGPAITEVSLRRGRDGAMRTESESWLVARDEAGAMYRLEEGGLSIRIGRVPTLPLTLAELQRNYRVEVLGRAVLDTGSAVAVGFHRGEVLRERLFVDDETRLVVRRETYDLAGEPVRVVALTNVVVSDQPVLLMQADGEDTLVGRTRLAPGQVGDLQGLGWQVPTTVGDGFELRASFVVNESDAVQLVYSDGLYTLSLLEQPGAVDEQALGGSVREVRDGVPLYRWPGVEPARVVWNGGGYTFTAVTDAPVDVLLDIVADLPHDDVPGVGARLWRGLGRLFGWMWPFD